MVLVHIVIQCLTTIRDLLQHNKKQDYSNDVLCTAIFLVSNHLKVCETKLLRNTVQLKLMICIRQPALNFGIYILLYPIKFLIY